MTRNNKLKCVSGLVNSDTFYKAPLIAKCFIIVRVYPAHCFEINISINFCMVISSCISDIFSKKPLTIETVNSGKTYLENHQYSSKKKRCIWKDERYTIADSLKEDAAAKLADMSKPYVSYSADIMDLSRNSQKYSILQYEIGDTVTLIDHVTGEKEKQRIVSMKIYPEAPEKNSCTLANKVLTFDELTQKYEDTADTVDNITNDNGQVDGDAIDGIHSRQIIDLENGIIESAYIKELGVKYLDVSGKITAVEGEFGILKSNTAQFEETYTKRLEAVEGDIYTLRTTDFTAVNAKIGILDNEFGNIKILLSGGAGIGEIQNIHLTSENLMDLISAECSRLSAVPGYFSACRLHRLGLSAGPWYLRRFQSLFL